MTANDNATVVKNTEPRSANIEGYGEAQANTQPLEAPAEPHAPQLRHPSASTVLPVLATPEQTLPAGYRISEPDHGVVSAPKSVFGFRAESFHVSPHVLEIVDPILDHRATAFGSKDRSKNSLAWAASSVTRASRILVIS